MPQDTTHVWLVFQELNAARSSGMAANPISFTEIDAYCRVTGTVMLPWEVGLVRRLDAVALSQGKGSGAAETSVAETNQQPPADSAEHKQRLRATMLDRRVVRRRRATDG